MKLPNNGTIVTKDLPLHAKFIARLYSLVLPPTSDFPRISAFLLWVNRKEGLQLVYGEATMDKHIIITPVTLHTSNSTCPYGFICMEYYLYLTRFSAPVQYARTSPTISLRGNWVEYEDIPTIISAVPFLKENPALTLEWIFFLPLLAWQFRLIPGIHDLITLSSNISQEMKSKFIKYINEFNSNYAFYIHQLYDTCLWNKKENKHYLQYKYFQEIRLNVPVIDYIF